MELALVTRARKQQKGSMGPDPKWPLSLLIASIRSKPSLAAAHTYASAVGALCLTGFLVLDFAGSEFSAGTAPERVSGYLTASSGLRRRSAALVVGCRKMKNVIIEGLRSVVGFNHLYIVVVVSNYIKIFFLYFMARPLISDLICV